MNLLLTGTMFWGNRTYNRGDLVTVQDCGLGLALIGAGKAIAADPEAAAEYARLFEPAPSAARAAPVTTSSTTSADEVLRELRRKRLTTPAMSTKVWVR